MKFDQINEVNDITSNTKLVRPEGPFMPLLESAVL